MENLKGKELFWGTMAHVPLITLIWISYIAYRYSPTLTFDRVMAVVKGGGGGNMPIAPIILTLCAIPVSLFIMRLKETSQFVYRNAESAYHFNVWLLKGYISAFIGSALGMWWGNPFIVLGFGFLIFAISTFSLIQAFIGVVMALRGKVFYYWYPCRTCK